MIIEIIKNPLGGNPIPNFILVTENGSQSLVQEEGEILLKDATIPTLAVSQDGLHFVPILKNHNKNEQNNFNSSFTDLSPDKKPQVDIEFVGFASGTDASQFGGHLQQILVNVELPGGNNSVEQWSKVCSHVDTAAKK